MDKRNWNIKLLGVSNLDRFFTLFEKSISTQFPEYTQNTRNYFTKKESSKKQFKHLIKKGKKKIFIAIANGKIVGYLTASKIYGGIGFCEWLGVSDEYQHKGVGTALLKKYETMSLKKGAHKIHLWTANKNISFYKKNGYILVGNIPENYFGTDEYLMYKILQEAKEVNYLKDF